MTTRKTPLPTLLRRFALITVAVTMLAVPLLGCNESNSVNTCSGCGKLSTIDATYGNYNHSTLACRSHRYCTFELSGETPDDTHTTQCEYCKGYFCDEGRHGCGIEGHCQTPGVIHTVAYCGIEGHFWCDGKEHSASICIEKSEPSEQPKEPEEPEKPEQPQEPVAAIPYCSHCHQTIAAANAHRAPCGGHYTCDAGYVPEEHAPLTDCAHFMCQYGDHYPCDYCGGMLCAGDHGFYSCDFMHTNCPNSTADDAYTHQKLGCGYHWDCDDTVHGTHTQLTCGCCGALTDHFMDCEHYGQPVA